MPETELSITFGKNLNNMLSKNGMNQQDLIVSLRSHGINVGAASVSYWCNGKKIPRPDKIDALCRIFNCKRRDLLEEQETDDPSGYYTDPETARLAQEMFEDPQMRSLFHMKRNMEPEKFKAHYDMMKKMYQLEHPEDGDDWA